MATISKIQGTPELRLTGQVDDTTRQQPEKTNQAPPRDLPEISKPKGVAQALQDTPNQQVTGKTFDSAEIKELVAGLQESLNRNSVDHHEVGFRKDPRTEAYVIEIKNPDGQVVKQFPPEKVLNMQQRMDELSGMVIDRMT